MLPEKDVVHGYHVIYRRMLITLLVLALSPLLLLGAFSLKHIDTIYSENFRTGDILIYINKNDVAYDYKDGKIIKNAVTYEDGEYAFVFIEGKGFVGVNYGADGISGTKDDRNEFTVRYYTNRNLKVCPDSDEKDEKVLEFFNYQTLFGKDYYVILRPSLGFNFTK